VKFVFHPEAVAELFDAIEYYENAEAGLGQDFSLEILSTIQNITNYPLAWPVLIDDVRRCLTNRFPFGVIYDIDGDQVRVLAVMHLRREPHYWGNRY
jgi:toxin ParE1/3/4